MNLFTDSKAVLFDLDGTLLPIRQEKFLEFYFKLLSQEFKDLAEPEEFIDGLWTATEKMIKNNEPRLNKEVFMEAFFSLFQVNSEADIIDRFNKFYRDEFPDIENHLELDQNGAERIISLFQDADYSLALATNPVFPRQAVAARLNWINLNPDQFELLTSYENMYYSKPNPKYYQQIVEKLGVEAEECVMIGNDQQEDMIAKKLGIKTVLISDFMIEREVEPDLAPDWQGSWKEFKQLVEENL